MGLSKNNVAIANFFDWFGAVAAALGLLGLLTGLLLFCINIGNEGRKRDKGSLCSDRDAMGYFVLKRKGGCFRLLPSFGGWPKAEEPEVPTLAGLFQAGDTLLYTSACFDSILPSHHEICWIDFYSAILDEIAYQPRSLKTIQDCAPKLRKALSMARISIKTKSTLAESSKHLDDFEGDPMTFSPRGPERHTLYQERKSNKPLLVACVRKLDIYGENGGQVNPQYVPAYGFEQLRRVWVFNRQPCIEMSSIELAELSLILGMKLYVRMFGTSSRLYGIGAFGIMLDGHICDGVWRTRIIHGDRDRSEGASKGSGYSTLHAKYIACGCLPFGQSKGWIEYVHMNDEVYQAIQGRHDICNGDDNSDGPARHALDFLAELSTIGHWSSYNRLRTRTAAQTQLQPYGMLGQMVQGRWIVDETRTLGGRPAKKASWARAVAYVAFGGLVPQSADMLANAIKFTILGNVQLNPHEKREQAEILEQIVNEIHRSNEGDYLFGPHVAFRLRDHKSGQKFAPMYIFQWNIRLAAATFSRYMTLIEYFVAQFDISGTGISNDDESSGRCDVAFVQLVEALETSHKAAVEQKVDKGQHVAKLRSLLQKIQAPRNRGKKFVPSLSDVTDLAICVIAIWAEHVPRIVVKVFNDQSHTIPVEGIWDTDTRVAFNLDCSEERPNPYHKHIALSGFTKSANENVYHAPALEDLPSISAFG